MKNYKKVIKWLEENQNKPVMIGVHAFEMSFYTKFFKGFKFTLDLVGSGEIDEMDGQTSIVLFELTSNSAIDVEFNNEVMNVFPIDGDMEYTINDEHFTIGFKLL